MVVDYVINDNVLNNRIPIRLEDTHDIYFSEKVNEIELTVAPKHE